MFTLKENKRLFDFGPFSDLPADWDRFGTVSAPEGATHWVRVSESKVGTLPGGMSPFRFAKILKTVAYVWTCDTEPVQKWKIKDGVTIEELKMNFGLERVD